jgi:menaquinone-dependent protoporphyrinogen oxidase
MKVLVAYAGKTGTTKKCVDYIKMISTEEVELYDAKEGKQIDINNYDIIIMGGSIRIGVMDNSIRNFARLNDFSEKKVGLFVVCGVSENSDKYLRTNFPDITPHNESCFGGEFQLGKFRGMEKMVIKRAIKDSRKKAKALPEVDFDTIKNFLDQLYYGAAVPRPDKTDEAYVDEADIASAPEYVAPVETVIEPEPVSTPAPVAEPVAEVKQEDDDEARKLAELAALAAAAGSDDYEESTDDVFKALTDDESGLSDDETGLDEDAVDMSSLNV